MAHTQHQTSRETQDAPTPDSRRTPDFLTTLTRRIPDSPWIGAFIAVTLVVTLIGGAISSGVDQIVRPPTPTRPAPSAAVTPTVPAPSTEGAISPSATPTSTPVEGATGEPTAPAGPASIELSTETIDFGAEGIAAEIELTNTGDQAADWTALSSSEAIAFSAPGGSLPPGETAILRVSLDRSLVSEGEVSETITIRWDDSEKAVEATATHEDNPIIHNPKASPATVNANGEGCAGTQTTISARIRDTSAITSVVARWSPDGSAGKETPLTSVGNDMFEGVVGPFTTARAASVKIVAFDERDNAGGASISVTVNACP